MHRTLPALLVLTLAACSSSSGDTSGTTGNGNGPGGSANGSTTTAGATGSGNGSTTGSSNGGGNGGSSTGGVQGTTGGSGGPVTVNNFNALFNDAICRYVYSCESVAYAPYVLNAACPAFEEVDYKDLPAAVSAGRLSFDATQATACIAALGSGGCSQLPIIQACYAFLGGTSGLVPPAGACYANADCLSATCNGYDSSTCAAGTCSGIVGPAGACDCTNCGSCDIDAGLSCISSVCTAPSGVGQPCGSGNPDCQFGLACPDTTCASLPITAGNECTPGDGECASSLYCFEKLSHSFGNCATQVAAGQPCGEDPDHQDSAFSDADNECAGAHPACVGAGTLNDAGIATGTCAQLSDVGGPCKPAAAAINTDLTYSDGCYAGLNCVGGACVKPPSSGACSATGLPCDPTTSYCADAGAGGNCLTFVPLGGTCSSSINGECGLFASCNSNNICQGSAPSCSPTL